MNPMTRWPSVTMGAPTLSVTAALVTAAPTRQGQPGHDQRHGHRVQRAAAPRAHTVGRVGPPPRAGGVVEHGATYRNGVDHPIHGDRLARPTASSVAGLIHGGP